MRNAWRILIVAAMCASSLMLVTTHGLAQGLTHPLPALPDQAIIDKMIKETNGPTFTPLGIPAATSQNINKAQGLTSAALSTDTDHAVHYIGIDTGITRSLVPLQNAATITFQPDGQTPDDQAPAKLIGFVSEPTKGEVALYAVWKERDATTKPSEIRFYSLDNKRLPDGANYKVVTRKLKGDTTGKPSVGDQGVTVAARETCFTFGLDQICYTPIKFTRDEKIAALAQQTFQELAKAYTFTTKFDIDGALPDVIGNDQRAKCATSLAQATKLSPQALPTCGVNLIFTATLQRAAGQPIGMFRVLKDAGLKAYDVSGNAVGKLPAGSYLVLDATSPEIHNQPGSVGALFLVNANGKDHFLIPSRVVEGFGTSDDQVANDRHEQAAIKDGLIDGQGF